MPAQETTCTRRRADRRDRHSANLEVPPRTGVLPNLVRHLVLAKLDAETADRSAFDCWFPYPRLAGTLVVRGEVRVAEGRQVSVIVLGAAAARPAVGCSISAASSR